MTKDFDGVWIKEIKRLNVCKTVAVIQGTNGTQIGRGNGSDKPLILAATIETAKDETFVWSALTSDLEVHSDLSLEILIPIDSEEVHIRMGDGRCLSTKTLEGAELIQRCLINYVCVGYNLSLILDNRSLNRFSCLLNDSKSMSRHLAALVQSEMRNHGVDLSNNS